MMTNFYN